MSRLDMAWRRWFPVTDNRDHPCPACGATDLGEVISRRVNVDECFGPQGVRSRRHLMIYCRERDQSVALSCWSCGHEWPRR